MRRSVAVLVVVETLLEKTTDVAARLFHSIAIRKVEDRAPID